MTLSRDDANSPAESTQVIKLQSYLFGFFNSKSLLLTETACPQAEILKAELRMSAQDLTLTILTLGIYVPHRVILHCSKINL